MPQTGEFLNSAAQFEFGPGEALVSFASNSLLSGDFTFACWFNYNSSEGYDGQGLISLGGTVWIGVRAYDGALNFGIKTDNTEGYSQALTPNASFLEYDWTHVAFVRAGGTLRIYVNGAVVASHRMQHQLGGLAKPGWRADVVSRDEPDGVFRHAAVGDRTGKSNQGTMTNMNPNEFIQAVEHAAGMNDRWLFLAAFCLLLIGCGVVIYWLVRQLQSVIADHKELRNEHHAALAQIIAAQNETAIKLAVCLDQNSEALRECAFELRRFQEGGASR